MGVAATGPSLVDICDPAGRPRGTGFPVDFDGTLLTSHETVDGLDRTLLRVPGVGDVLTEDGQITTLPEWNLALLRTTGLCLEPFVLATGRARLPGTRVRLCGERTLEARVAGTASVTYAATDRFHTLDDVLTLAMSRPLASQLRLSRRASGSPVLDASTGAVLAVLCTAMHAASGGRTAAFAVRPRALGGLEPAGPLDRLLRHHDATVPGFGVDLNLAGALRLTGTSIGPPARTVGEPVLRPEIAEELRAFDDGAASVVALVGDPGSGRTTELAAWAARRARGVVSAPNVWLRGADLRTGDPSVREAVARVLRAAGRIVAPPDEGPDAPGGADRRGRTTHSEPVVGTAGEVPPAPAHHGSAPQANPDVVARLARDAGRPLLVLLDAPEEMPAGLLAGLRNWTAGSSSWLRASGARLAVACRPEFWEQWGLLFPPDTLHVPGRTDRADSRPEAGRPRRKQSPVPVRPTVLAPRAAPATRTAPHRRTGAVLPPCLRVRDLTPGQAARLRGRGALSADAIAPADARHPLLLRMAAELRAAAQHPDGVRPTSVPRQSATTGHRAGTSAEPGPPGVRHRDTGGLTPGPPSADEILAGYLALVSLRVALRLTAAGFSRPAPSGVRRLAARVSGQLHAAARRSLTSPNGALSRAAFEELFPADGGWASAVLAEGVLTPTAEAYHFVDEEFADWLQGRHVELGGALDALVHRAGSPRAAADRVPRHRIGPVLQALLRCGRTEGPELLSRRLCSLLPALRAVPPVGGSDPSWWAAHLLGETLSRVPDARPYLSVLEALAARVRSEGGSALFGPWFWRGLPLRTADLVRLVRLLLPTDPAYDEHPSGDRHLDTVAGLLSAEPEVVAPLLCTWFDDERLLASRRGAGPPPTVAGAAQALLYACRECHSAELLRTLAASTHPRARELLAELLAGPAVASPGAEATPPPHRPAAAPAVP
ncbi:trypsin-like peptidase domain-containing protein, partial [Streptomyces oceani]|uniref:trypsin-like peptidase domain-containing protein n=1 Tax=Streptomyces oceani TaxID=1075402 RepID=UPI000871C71E